MHNLNSSQVGDSGVKLKAKGKRAEMSARGKPKEGPIVKEVILDQETGKPVAFVRNGEVFRHTKENEKIGTMHAGVLRDLNGNEVGHLKGDHVIGGPDDRIMPLPFRKLLGGE